MSIDNFGVLSKQRNVVKVDRNLNLNHLRGQPLMIWGGGRRKSRKKIGGHSPGKNILRGTPGNFLQKRFPEKIPLKHFL